MNLTKAKETKTRVCCLYRVSTKGQVDKAENDIPMQKKACHEFAESKGWTIIKEHAELGVSGFKVAAADRDELQEIKREAEKQEFDILLVFMFDRLGRKDNETPFVLKWCALPGFVDSKNEEKTERNAGYLVVSHSGGGMLRQGTRKGIRRTPANRGMRAHRIVKSLDISEDVCHGLCP